jgi:hypothetical protein
MHVFKAPLTGAAEGSFESKAIDHVELFPDDHSSSALSVFLNHKTTVFETHGVVHLVEHVRKYSFF